MIYDIAIIGAGPAGYTAAISAAKEGYQVALIEGDQLGGTCLNWGCIPTKTYYKNADFLKNLRSADVFGVSLQNFSFSLDEARKRKDEVVAQLKKGVAQLIEAHNITYINGQASFLSPSLLQVHGVETRQVQAKNIIIATGSKSRKLTISGADHSAILDSQSILELSELPQDLLIIGGGVIGIEFASIFNYFGSNVHVVEFMPDILLNEDREIVKRFLPLLKKQGVKVSLSAEVTDILPVENGFVVTIKNKKGQLETIEVSHVLQAAGRVANSSGLDIEKAGVEQNKGMITVDQNYMTTANAVFAIGDVNGISMLAHAASHQAIKVVEHIKNPDKKSKHGVIPSCTFSFPEISSVGLTEEQAIEKGINYKKNKFLFVANGKSLSLGNKDGFVKVITDQNHVILGVHILGPHASDLIHEAVLAVDQGLKVEDIADMIHAHPTLSEAFHEATAGIIGKAIHQI